MRAPLVKFPAIDRETGRCPPEQTAHEHARSAEADVCLFPVFVPNADRIGRLVCDPIDTVPPQAGASWWGRGDPRTNSYPCRLDGRTPHPLCARSAGTTPGTGFLLQPRAGSRPIPSTNASTPVPMREGGPRLRSQHRARRDDPLLAIAPQRDQQPARQRHDANPAEPPAAGAKARPIPPGQLTVRLPPHPTPPPVPPESAGLLFSPARRIPWSCPASPL